MRNVNLSSAKRHSLILLLPGWLLFSLCLFNTAFAQTNYYYKGTGSLSVVSNWGNNADGSGTNPVNFTSNNQIFNINNTTSVSLTSSWTVSGTNSQVVITNGVNFTTEAGSNLNIGASSKLVVNNGATLQSDVAVTLAATSTFQIDNGGVYIHNNTGTLSTTIFRGIESFGTTSTFQVNNWVNSTTPLTSSLTRAVAPGDGRTYFYGNLVINWAIGAGVIWDQLWSSAIYLAAGDFTVTSSFNGTFRMTSANANISVYVYGNVGCYSNIATLDFTTQNRTVYLYVNGNLTLTGGTITASGNSSSCKGIIATYGNGTSTWTVSNTAISYVYYRINSPKQINLGSDIDFGSNANPAIITIVAGSVLDAAGYKMSTGTSSTISIAGTLRTSNVDGLFRGTNTTLVKNGAIYLQPSFVAGGTVEYYATGNQYITDTSRYQNITISGGGTKTLLGSSTIYKTLNLSSGKLDVLDYLLTITNTGNITGYNSNNYIVTGSNTGRLIQNALPAATARIFPVGTSSCYLPATVTPASASFNYRVNVFTGVTTNGLYNGIPWTATQKKGMVDAVWNVERSAISNVADVVNFQWDNCYGSLEGSDFAAALNTDIGIWYWASGTSWSLAATGFSSNNNDAGGNNTSANSGTFRYSSTSGGNTHYIVAINSATLELGNIKLTAELINKQVSLNWTAEKLTERVSSFDIERSYDKTHFIKLASQPFADKPVFNYTDALADAGQVYYRVKMIYANGKISYSNITLINTGRNREIKLLGNPVFTEVVLQHPPAANAQYRFITLDGKTILSGSVNRGTGMSRINVNQLNNGVYMLQYSDDGEIKNFKVIKQ